MSDDWQPGDLALCVKRTLWKRGGPRPGSVNTVTAVVNGVGRVSRRSILGLIFEPGGEAYWADRFRKIRPLTPEEHEETMTELLTGKPVKEVA